MIRHSSRLSGTSIRDDIRARFRDALKRVETRENEAAAAGRKAIARAAARKAKGKPGSGWRVTRVHISLAPSRRRASA